MLDFSALEKAIAQLNKSLQYCNSKMAKEDEDLFFQFRQAAIQAFEYTYELSIKMLRRQLEEIESSAEVDRLSFRDLIRTGAEKEFIQEPTQWFTFRECRNITSYTYEANKAKQVYERLHDFSLQAQYLHGKLVSYK